MYSYLIVFVGAGLGGAVRHAVNASTLAWLGPGFPVATLAVNVVGSFLMGVLAGWFALRGDPGGGWRLFLTTGLLGGFTTFSTFSLDAVALYQQGQWLAAALYVMLSLFLALAGLLGGLYLIRMLG